MHPMASLLSTTLNITARVAPGPVGRMAFALFVRPLDGRGCGPAKRRSWLGP